MEKICGKCGGVLELGYASSPGEPRLQFVVLGKPTSANPIKALMQGLAGEQVNRTFGIQGYRCSGCGALELYAEEDR